MNTKQKITQLRAAMQANNLDAYIIPSSDPHQSEYVADHWNARKWLSGFDGSAGTLVVTADWAGLWTDSRYFLQAEEQLKDSPIELKKKQAGRGLEYNKDLVERLASKNKIGLDGRLFSVNQIKLLQAYFEEKELELLIDFDLISDIWEDRPMLSAAPIFVHDIQYSGKTSEEKIGEVRAKMQEEGATTFLISSLDEIAYLFNLRGKDTPFNPVFYAYASVTPTRTYLFIDETKVSNELIEILESNQIEIFLYEAFLEYVQTLSNHQKVWIDSARFPAHLYPYLEGEKIEKESPIRLQKATKNEIEIGHLRKTMEKDGVALLRAFYYLENTLKVSTVSEFEFGKQLHLFRSQQAHYQGDSFDPIVGYNANGAIVHYRAKEKNCANIKATGILLVDSGGQYLDGTTDITRTICLGEASAAQKHHFTLVLKGHIALANIRFPKGTSGVHLDVLARQYLWQNHLNYGHGTGHGVGFFLNVHESPPNISPSLSNSLVSNSLEIGMIMSNEPGYYKAGDYGIRIENLILCKEDEGLDGSSDFLKFETLSLFPIDQNLIDLELMNSEEIKWLNDYHAEVYRRLSPYLEEDEKVYLAASCSRLSKVIKSPIE